MSGLWWEGLWWVLGTMALMGLSVAVGNRIWPPK